MLFHIQFHAQHGSDKSKSYRLIDEFKTIGVEASNVKLAKVFAIRAIELNDIVGLKVL